jgi:hypothetical protein
MPDLIARAAEVVDKLTAEGIRAVIDDRDINPPCVYLRPPVMTFKFGGCTALTYEVRVIVPDSGTRGALDALGPLVEAVQAALGYPAPTVTPGWTALPDGGAAPMYSFNITTKP